MMVNTVSGESELFSQRYQQGAALEKRAYGMMGFPSERDVMNMGIRNLISSCPVIPDGVAVANKIYGPNLHYLKGKTVTRQPTLVVMDYIAVLPKIIKEHGDMKV